MPRSLTRLPPSAPEVIRRQIYAKSELSGRFTVGRLGARAKSASHSGAHAATTSRAVGP